MSIKEERRSAERHPLHVDVKYLLRGVDEGAGQLLDISEGGLALLTDINAVEGDQIVVYPIGLGRIEGRVARVFEGGIGISFIMSATQRETIRERIDAALEGKTYMRLVEKRSNLRIRYNIETTAVVEGMEEPVLCTIVDMSRSGCLLKSDVIPELGKHVVVGALEGAVKRQTSDGFAVEFMQDEIAAPPPVAATNVA